MANRMYRFFAAVLLAAAALTGCGGDASGSSSQRPSWNIGFWFWNGSSSFAKASVTVDALYVQGGSVRRGSPIERGRPWFVYGALPSDLPAAKQYWLVYRFEEPAVPADDILPELRGSILRVLAEAGNRKLPLAGIQFDIDCPTNHLPEYAHLLRQVRSELPEKTQVSITALLDWFRPGTAIADVVKHVDEFVPQFYDVGNQNRREVIAAPVDANQWGPAFERLGKPYRIGVSSFGRARSLTKRGAGYSVLPDLTPLNVARLSGMKRTQSSASTGEIRLVYEATKPVEIRWRTLEPGDRFEFILPIAQSMRTAVEAARGMGSHCAGVIFFRWPTMEESVSAQPDQALRAAGVIGQLASVQLIQQEKGCAAVRCTDLFLADAEPLSPEPVRYIIRCSVPLEYFLPSEIRAADIELSRWLRRSG